MLDFSMRLVRVVWEFELDVERVEEGFDAIDEHDDVLYAWWYGQFFKWSANA